MEKELLALRAIRDYIALGQHHPADSPLGRVFANCFPGGIDDAAIALLIRITKAASMAEVGVDPDPIDAHVFKIDGRQFVAPRQSPALWLFYMAIRDGWADARWMFPGDDPARCADNARRRVVGWLDMQGFQTLANQVRRCRLSGALVTFGGVDTWDMRG